MTKMNIEKHWIRDALFQRPRDNRHLEDKAFGYREFRHELYLHLVISTHSSPVIAVCIPGCSYAQ